MPFNAFYTLHYIFERVNVPTKPSIVSSVYMNYTPFLYGGIIITCHLVGFISFILDINRFIYVRNAQNCFDLSEKQMFYYFLYSLS